MRDFTCCDHTWPTLHDLIQHFEESHHGSGNAMVRPADAFFMNAGGSGRANGGRTDNAATMATDRAQTLAHSLHTLQQARHGGNAGMGARQQLAPANPRVNQVSQMNDEINAIGEMEMDDAVGPIDLDDDQQRTMQQTRQLFGQQQRPQLHLNITGLPHQALRTSSPTTPAAQSFGLQNNPTVSSVNTPTLTTQQSLPPTAQQFPQDRTGNTLVENMLGLPGGNGNLLTQFSRPTIDDPGRRLSSPGGPSSQVTNQQRQFEQQLQIQQRLAAMNVDLSQLPAGTDAATLLQQLSTMMMPNEEHKPFRCPVVGCEKAYKNQNGLKLV